MVISTSGTQQSVSGQRGEPRNIAQLLLSSRYWIYLLILAAISLPDYAYLAAAYLNWLNPWVFLVISDIHDALALVPITLAARRFHGKGGYVASVWLGLVHTPHYYMVWPDLGRLSRLIVICGIGGFMSYLVDLYYKQSREREKVYRDMLDTRQQLNNLDKMFQSEKMQALGRMAAGVAHDFNNILAAILFQAEVAIRLSNQEAVRTYLANIQQAAQDGAETVKRIREFTRTQPTVNRLELVSLKEIVESAVEMSKPQWKDGSQAKGVTIRINISMGNVPPIRGNAAQLRQMLVNLIINSVEAMPQGGDINIGAATKDGSTALVVADNGVGMDEETARRAFEPFFTTKGPHNNGLGLSAAYGIVAQHGGQLTVHSKKGEGTTFTVTFPLPLEEPEVAVRSKPAIPYIKGLNILVVDDEPLVARGLADLLRLEGHRVAEYTNPVQALAELQNGDFDVVFTDLGMPEMNGWQLSAKIKELSNRTPVVMLTGWGEEMVEKEQQNQGQVDFLLGKPVIAERVNQIIAEIVGRGQKNVPGV